MVNAQEWLNENYPIYGRSGIAELDIKSKNLEGSLDLSDFVNLETLYCQNNQISQIKLPQGEKLEYLDLRNNNLNQDLSFLKDLVNLWNLDLSNNPLYGSLEPLKNLVNLNYLYISSTGIAGSFQPLKDLNRLNELQLTNTHVDSGLEYLPDSLEKIECYKWKCNEKLDQELKKYKRGWSFFSHYYYNFPLWKVGFLRKEVNSFNKTLAELKKEISSLHSQLNDKNQEINSLQTWLTGNQTIINNLQGELSNTQTKLSETNLQLNQTISQLNNTNSQLTAWKAPFFRPQLSWNQPDSAITFRTQLNSFDLAGTAGLCLVVRHLYRKYKQRQILPQDEERQPLLRTPEEINRLNQEIRRLNLELNQIKDNPHNQAKLTEISQIVSPNEELSADNLKREISRLKSQELAPQVREEKTKFEQLLAEIKNKAGNSAKVVDLLLDAYKQKKRATGNSQKDRLDGEIEAYQRILENNNLNKEEIQNLLDSQIELQKIEQHLANLQQNQEQQAQIIQQQPFGLPSSSK